MLYRGNDLVIKIWIKIDSRRGVRDFRRGALREQLREGGRLGGVDYHAPGEDKYNHAQRDCSKLHAIRGLGGSHEEEEDPRTQSFTNLR